MRPFGPASAVAFVFAALAFLAPPISGQTTIVGWGGNGYGEITAPPPPVGQEFVALSGGHQATGALTNAGQVLLWGSSAYGGLNVPVPPLGVVYTKIVVAGWWSLGLRSDGQLVAWGNNTYGGVNVPALPSGMTYVDCEASSQNSAAIRSDGAVVTWGDASWNQLAVPTPPTGVTYVEIAIGLWFMLGRRSDGQIVGWGRNTYGQLNVPAPPSGTSYVRVFAGASFGAALRSDGQLVAWGQNHAGQTNVPALGPGQTYVDASAYGHHIVALRSDGVVLCFGENLYGQCNVPTFPADRRVVDVEAGSFHTLARLEPLPPPPPPCVVGQNAALAFDGVDDFVRVGAPPELDLAGAVTLEAWVRPTNLATAQDVVVRGLRNSAPSFFQGVALAIEPVGPAGAATPHYVVGSVLSDGYAQAAFAPAAPSDLGTWVHLAGCYDGSAWRLYKNGALVAAAPSVIGAIPTPSEWTIGAHDGLARFFQGAVDEVRIWNRARTAAETLADRDRGLSGYETGLVGYWRCDGVLLNQPVANAAQPAGAALDAVRGATAAAGADDPAWTAVDLPQVLYCPPCPNPPCGQTNTACATLTINGVGVAAQGPFLVAVPPGGTMTFDWYGPPNQPYVLVAAPQLVPGQTVFAASFVVDVDVASYAIVFSGFDPFLGPFFHTNAAGHGSQSWTNPSAAPLGATLNLQGLVYDLAEVCPDGLPYMTTAAFAVAF